MGKKVDFNEFVQKSNEIHSRKYKYDASSFINLQSKVKIFCPIHGEFEQIAQEHMRGHGCLKCAVEKRGKNTLLNKDEFLRLAKEIHGDKYDYSKVDYVNATTKVTIICAKHGEFDQSPLNHVIKKHGCPKCKGRGLTREEVIDRFKFVHGDKYNYSKFIFTRMDDKSIIICPKHGEFLQSASKHAKGKGCPKCGKESAASKTKTTTDEFIERASEIHQNKYDYSKTEYKSIFDKVTIICPIHGEFEQRANDHLNGHGCAKCGIGTSYNEVELYDSFVRLMGNVNILHSDRSILGNNQEIDIVFPNHKLGIEYDGLKWHTEEYGKDQTYHLNKTLTANQKGYQLVHVFEDEYLHHRAIVKSKIRRLLGIAKNESFIEEQDISFAVISQSEAMSFATENELGEVTEPTITIGAFVKDELFATVLFNTENNKDWIIQKTAYSVKHMFDADVYKLMINYFIEKFEPNTIDRYLDRRWATSHVTEQYEDFGFEFVEEIEPSYKYVNTTKCTERFDKSEIDVTNPIYSKIYDCGLFHYRLIL